jgi:tetratricopeptide (TPR) repeat protein/S-adenosylhomocysteine hydrolase
MNLTELIAAREAFFRAHPCMSDDKKAPEFYRSLRQRPQLRPKNSKKKTVYIAVAHLVHSLTTFLEGLVGDDVIGAFIPKGSQTVKNIADSLKEHYAPLLEHGLTKEHFFKNPERVSTFLNEFMKHYPPEEYEYQVMDHGGYFAQHMYSLPKAFFENCRGVTEHTLNGLKAYKEVIEKHGQLLSPVYSIATSKVKVQENNEVADSICNAIFSQILGAEGLHRPTSRLEKVAFIGAGNIGRNTAKMVSKRLRRQASLVVCDIDPYAREKTNEDIPSAKVVSDQAEAIKDADLIFVATSGVALNAEDFTSMRSGTCVVFGTSYDSVVSENALVGYQKNDALTTDYVTCLEHETTGHTLYLAAHGGSVNFLAGSTSHPIIHAVLGEVVTLSDQLKRLTPFERKNACKHVTVCNKYDDQYIREKWEKQYGPMTDYNSLSRLVENGWKVPRNNDFAYVGRETVISNTHANLQHDKVSLIAPERNRQHGLGISATATHYLHTHAEHYPIQIWLDANSQEALFRSIYKLAKALHIKKTKNTNNPHQQTDSLSLDICQSEAVQLMQDIYKKISLQHANCLIVFNKASNSKLINALLPEKSHKKIYTLIAAKQSENWSMKQVALKPFSKEEIDVFLARNNIPITSSAYRLIKRSDRKPSTLSLFASQHHFEEGSDSDSESTNSEPLFPASAYYIANDTEYNDDTFPRLTPWEVDEELLPLDSTYRSDRLSSASSTYLNLLRHLAENHSEIHKTLSYCALLYSKNIPTSLFDSFDESNSKLDQLHHVGLISLSQDRLTFSISTQLQRLLKPLGRQESDLAKKAAGHLAACMEINPEELNKLEHLKKWIPHAIKLTESCKAHKIHTKYFSKLLFSLGYYYSIVNKNINKGIAYLEMALPHLEGTTKGLALNTLTFCHIQKHQDSTASHYLDKAIKCLVEDDIHIAESVLLKGHLAFHKGEYKKALSLYNKALNLLNKADPEKKIYRYRRSVILSNIGRVYNHAAYAQHDYMKAELYFKHALTLIKKISDQPSVDQAFCLTAISSACTKQNRHDDARSTLDQAQAIYQTLYQNEPKTEKGILYEKMAEFHRAQGNLEEAKKHFESALEMYRMVGNRFKLANGLLRYSHFCELNEAVKLCQDARNIFRELQNSLGETDATAHIHEHISAAKKQAEKDMAAVKKNPAYDEIWLGIPERFLDIAHTYAAEENHKLAIEHFQIAYDIYLRRLCDKDNVISVSIQMTEHLIATQQYKRAIDIAKKAVQLECNKASKDPYQFFYLRFLLAEAYHKKKDYPLSFSAIQSLTSTSLAKLPRETYQKIIRLILTHLHEINPLLSPNHEDHISDLLSKLNITTDNLNPLIEVANKMFFSNQLKGALACYHLILKLFSNRTSGRKSPVFFINHLEQTCLIKEKIIRCLEKLNTKTEMLIEAHSDLKNACVMLDVETKKMRLERNSVTLGLSQAEIRRYRSSKRLGRLYQDLGKPLLAVAHYENAAQFHSRASSLSGFEAAKANLNILSEQTGHPIEFDKDARSKLRVDNQLTIYFVYDDRTQLLYCYTLVLDELPESRHKRNILYKDSLYANAHLKHTNGCGIGLDRHSKSLYMHHALSMQDCSCLSLIDAFQPFINTVTAWKTYYKQFVSTGKPSKMPVFSNPFERCTSSTTQETELSYHAAVCNAKDSSALEKENTSRDQLSKIRDLALEKTREHLQSLNNFVVEEIPEPDKEDKFTIAISPARKVFINVNPANQLLNLLTPIAELSELTQRVKHSLYEAALEDSLLGKDNRGGNICLDCDEQKLYIQTTISLSDCHGGALLDRLSKLTQCAATCHANYLALQREEETNIKALSASQLRPALFSSRRPQKTRACPSSLPCQALGIPTRASR